MSKMKMTKEDATSESQRVAFRYKINLRCVLGRWNSLNRCASRKVCLFTLPLYVMSVWMKVWR